MGVLLISEIKLKNFTNINKNVDMDVLKAEVQVAQDIDLQTILGSKFYYELLSKVSATGNTFNADELELVNSYIQPFLIQTAYFQAIPHLMYRTLNRGIQEGNNEFGSPVQIETMKYLRSLQKNRADFYLQRLMDYLLTGRGQNKFPSYNNASTIDGMIPDRVQKYNNGIFLNKSTRYGWSAQQVSGVVSSQGGNGFYSERAMNFYPDCPECL